MIIKANFVKILNTDQERIYVIGVLEREQPDRRKYPNPTFRKHGYTINNLNNYLAYNMFEEAFTDGR